MVRPSGTGDGAATAESSPNLRRLNHPVAWVAALVAVSHLAVATRFGWHRDEFYYVATGRRLDWGFVDQPPLTPLLARFADALPGDLLPLRLMAIAFRVGTVVLTGAIARQLGGGRVAQGLAAACAAGCGIFVGGSLLLGTTVVDQFLWALVFLLVVRALDAGTLASWAAVGAAAGLGLENKRTMAVLLVGLAAGLAVRRRDIVRQPGPWLAAALAAALLAPNLIWDARTGWSTFDMAAVLADKQGGVPGALAELPLLLVLLPSPTIVFMWVRGARWGVSDRRHGDHSWIVVAAALVVVAFTIAGGKPYYSAPLLAPLFALGAVATEHRWRSAPSRRGPTVWLVASSVVVAPVLSLPYLSPEVDTALRVVSKEPMETYGWPRFTAQVAAATANHPDAVAVYVSNYGEAGALGRYGLEHGLELPVVAGQNAYRDWGPPDGTPTTVVAVGQFDRVFLERSWNDVRRVGTITFPDGIENEEIENDAAIYLCAQPLGTWRELWPRLSYLS